MDILSSNKTPQFLEMWVARIDWDDLFQEDLAGKARKWFTELEDPSTIKVPRCLRLGKEEEVLSQTLHTFVDVSQDAYGAVVYSGATYRSGTVSKRFVTATTSIPRLELMAKDLKLRMTDSSSRVLNVTIDQEFSDHTVRMCSGRLEEDAVHSNLS